MREGSPELGEQIACFLDDLTLAGRSPATVRTYAFFVRKIDKPNAAHTDGTQIATNASLASDCTTACRSLMRHYVQRVKSAQTCYNALACFGRYQVEQGWTVESPMARIPFPKAPPPAPRQFLTADQVRSIYAACPDNSQRLMIRLLLTGLRVSELCSAKLKDVRGDRLTIRGKGGFSRAVVLDAETVAMLDGPLLMALTTNAVRERVKKLGRSCNIPGLTPHSFRRTMASQALLAGMDSRHVRTLGGWQSERVFASRYVAFVLEDAALDAARGLNLTATLLEPPLGVVDVSQL